MAKIVIGLAGEMASGKTTITKYLQDKYDASLYRFSNILRDILTRIHLEHSRENLQMMSTALRGTFGEDILAKAIAEDADRDETGIIAVDGVRRLGDIEHLKKIPGFKLVYVEADIEKCHERIFVRNENVDDEGKTFEEFQKDRAREAEQQIKELIPFADIVVDNNGSLDDLYKQIEKFIILQ